MKTVVSETGVEVIYPCSVHLLNGDLLEVEYKSDQIGQDLMNFICDHLGFTDKEDWDFGFVTNKHISLMDIKILFHRSFPHCI